MEDASRARWLLDVIGDADRLKIIGRLLERGWTITQLAEELGMKPQSVTRHIRTLDDAGLIQQQEDEQGQVAFDAASLREQISAIRPEERSAFPDESDEDARILRSFIADGRLVQLPSQRSRWSVVLRWLSEQFEPDREYRETEVNEILGRIHEDYALLRRQLVDEGLMARDHGVYWRVQDAEPPA